MAEQQLGQRDIAQVASVKEHQAVESEPQNELGNQALVGQYTNADDAADALNGALSGWLGDDERLVFGLLHTGSVALTETLERTYNHKFDHDLRTRIEKRMSGWEEERALFLLDHGRLTLAFKIRESLDRGLLTVDQDGIVEACRRAAQADLAEVAADPSLLAKIQDNVSERDWAEIRAWLQGEGIAVAPLLRALDNSMWGDDEDDIWATLSKLGEDEKQTLTLNQELMDLVAADLDAGERKQFELMLEKGELDNIDRLEVAFLGGHVDDMLAALKAMTADEIGRLDFRIWRERLTQALVLSETEAIALLNQHQIAGDAETAQSAGRGQPGFSVLQGEAGQTSHLTNMLVATAGWGIHKDQVLVSISAMTTEERAFVLKNNPQNILDILASELSEEDHHQVLRALGPDNYDSLVAQLDAVLDGFGGETVVYNVLNTVCEKPEITDALVGRRQALARVFDDDQMAIVQGVIDTGRFSAAQRVQWVLSASPPDPEQVTDVVAQFKDELSTDGVVHPAIDEMLTASLNKRDYWSAVDAIRGKPESNRDKVLHAQELLDRERSSGFSNGVMDFFSWQGDHADLSSMEYTAAYNQAVADGVISQGEQAGLDDHEAWALEQMGDYRALKSTTAAVGGIIASVVAGIVVAVVPGAQIGAAALGAMAGKLSALMLAGAAGAAANVGVKEALEGEAYDLGSREALVDAMTGAVVAATATLSSLVVEQLFAEGVSAAAKVAAVDEGLAALSMGGVAAFDSQDLGGLAESFDVAAMVGAIAGGAGVQAIIEVLSKTKRVQTSEGQPQGDEPGVVLPIEAPPTRNRRKPMGLGDVQGLDGKVWEHTPGRYELAGGHFEVAAHRTAQNVTVGNIHNYDAPMFIELSDGRKVPTVNAVLLDQMRQLHVAPGELRNLRLERIANESTLILVASMRQDDPGLSMGDAFRRTPMFQMYNSLAESTGHQVVDVTTDGGQVMPASIASRPPFGSPRFLDRLEPDDEVPVLYNVDLELRPAQVSASPPEGTPIDPGFELAPVGSLNSDEIANLGASWSSHPRERLTEPGFVQRMKQGDPDAIEAYRATIKVPPADVVRTQGSNLEYVGSGRTWDVWQTPDGTLVKWTRDEPLPDAVFQTLTRRFDE